MCEKKKKERKEIISSLTPQNSALQFIKNKDHPSSRALAYRHHTHDTTRPSQQLFTSSYLPLPPPRLCVFSIPFLSPLHYPYPPHSSPRENLLSLITSLPSIFMVISRPLPAPQPICSPLNSLQLFFSTWKSESLKVKRQQERAGIEKEKGDKHH